jgi:hypothetical protein
MKVYRDQILEGVVKPWLLAGTNFAMEEDRDSAHGVNRPDQKRQNIVQLRKKDASEAHGFRYYFNCATSPDLSSIENAWQPMKQHIRRF